MRPSIEATTPMPTRVACPLCDAEGLDVSSALALGVMVGVIFGSIHAVVQTMCEPHRVRFIADMVTATNALSRKAHA